MGKDSILLTKKRWAVALNNLKGEMAKLKGTDKEPNFRYNKNAFCFDYHYIYPPGKVRQYYFWERGRVSGKRTAHWCEGPGGYDYYIYGRSNCKRYLMFG